MVNNIYDAIAGVVMIPSSILISLGAVTKSRCLITLGAIGFAIADAISVIPEESMKNGSDPKKQKDS